MRRRLTAAEGMAARRPAGERTRTRARLLRRSKARAHLAEAEPLLDRDQNDLEDWLDRLRVRVGKDGVDGDEL